MARVDQILAHHTGQPLERVRADTDRDFILGAEDAMAYGLVDEVLSPRRGLALVAAAGQEGGVAQVGTGG